ncbi:hypothetical protein M409DRAFT_28770 [Zasmidium cellare ATCC 36951]|uniref:BD-FAE-like domain-containing protein n=1 Tax=Zasmidium cellare ATCC 36951 TaxID=1080233 RepID=A0A6A6C3Y0_ZASCE|nr:uncharacterized protein M409DRAFT_28770 [Zasmidium cellare ATCC 36951]KAF2160890.1 hypothetical protein M409DRAFT_28770 [Zasmidium cellare ATCC 36951]
MDQLPPLGKDIRDVILPTLKIYDPLLRKNADKIRSIKKETHSYGPSERQQLDAYHAAKPRLINGRQAVLVFLYGGGLVNGHKVLPGYADDLCHANVAAFFASHYGYNVVVPDYRLVNSHDAKFPSGGEDVALAVEWVFENAGTFGPEPIDLFIMGNSAGGVHLSTFLLHPDSATARAKVLNGSGVRLRGAILLSVPFNFDYSHPSRAEVLNTYFGNHKAFSPQGLLKTAQNQGSIDFIQAGVRAFILDAELDPEDEILQTRDDFIKQWMLDTSKENRGALAVDWMPRQNHISPFCSLSTGLEEEEAWGHQVGAFCDNIRKFRPS